MHRTSKNFFLLLFTFGFFGTMLAVLWHIHTATDESRNRNIQVRELIQEENEKNSREEILRENLKSALVHRDDLKKHIVSRADVLEFIKLIEGVGARHNTELSIDSINIGEPAEGAPLGSADGKFRISVRGTWKDVTRALFSLENLPYKLHLTTAHFEKLGSQESSSQSGAAAAAKTAASMIWRADVELSIKTLP